MVVKNTWILFSNEEMILLKRWLRYNLYSKHKDWIKNLALEAETAVSYL
jgi:hypothetical protein